MKSGGWVWLFVLWVVFSPGVGTALADSSKTEGVEEMVLIPAGEFLMGSPRGPAGRMNILSIPSIWMPIGLTAMRLRVAILKPIWRRIPNSIPPLPGGMIGRYDRGWNASQ